MLNAANGTPLAVVGSVSFTVCLSPTLEMDLEGVAVQELEGYLAFLGTDVLIGKAGILGAAEI